MKKILNITLIIIGLFTITKWSFDLINQEGRQYTVMKSHVYTRGLTIGGLYNNRLAVIAKENETGYLKYFEFSSGKRDPSVGDEFKIRMGKPYLLH